MAYRCEYCGQLFDGLSCPHCGAPRGDDDPSVGIFYADNVPYWRSDVGLIDRDGNPVAIDSASNGSAVSQTVIGNGSVSVCGNGNTIHTNVTPRRADDWAKWSEQMDPEWNPEEHPESVDYFLVDIDPYKGERVYSDVTGELYRVGGPETVEDESPGCLSILLLALMIAAPCVLFGCIIAKALGG